MKLHLLDIHGFDLGAFLPVGGCMRLYGQVDPNAFKMTSSALPSDFSANNLAAGSLPAPIATQTATTATTNPAEPAVAKAPDSGAAVVKASSGLADSPWAIDAAAFHAAVDPVLQNSANPRQAYDPNWVNTRASESSNYSDYIGSTAPGSGLSQQWSSEADHTGRSVALPLAGGKTWTPSGANSGITYHPPTQQVIVGFHTEEVPAVNADAGPTTRTVPTYGPPPGAPEGNYPNGYYTVSGDLSALLGKSDTNVHGDVIYVEQNGKMVPVKEPTTWNYQNGGLMKDLAPVLAIGALAVGVPAIAGWASGGAAAAGAAAGASGAAAGVDSLDALLASNGAFGTAAAASTAAGAAGAASVFNAAADSQLANVAINAAGGNALAGYIPASGVAGALGMNAGMGATALNAGVTNAAVNLAGGGNMESALKAGVTGAVLSPVAGWASSGVKELLPDTLSAAAKNAVGSVASGAATGGVGAAITGNSITDGILNGAKNGAINAAGNYVGGLAQEATGSQTVAGAASGGIQAILHGTNPLTGIIAGAIDGGTGVNGLGTIVTNAANPKNANTSIPVSGFSSGNSTHKSINNAGVHGTFGNVLSAFKSGTGTLKKQGA